MAPSDASSTTTFEMWDPGSGAMTKRWLAPWLTATDPLGVIVPPSPAVAVITKLGGSKAAPMLLFVSIVRVMGLVVPDAAPVQPTNTYPAAGVAVRSTVLPSRYLA